MKCIADFRCPIQPCLSNSAKPSLFVMNSQPTHQAKAKGVGSAYAIRLSWGVVWFFALWAAVTSSSVEPRMGLTVGRETLVSSLPLVVACMGVIFRFGPVVMFPTVAALLSSLGDVNGLSALQHTVLFVLLGCVLGLAASAIWKQR